MVWLSQHSTVTGANNGALYEDEYRFCRSHAATAFWVHFDRLGHRQSNRSIFLWRLVWTGFGHHRTNGLVWPVQNFLIFYQAGRVT